MIRKVEVIPYALPFRQPYVTARGRLRRRELILLRLTDADGVVGLGETTSLSLRGGRALAEIAAELEEAGRRVLELPANHRGIAWDEIGMNRCSPETRCAYAMAAADLDLRANGQPIEDEPAPVPCNATLSAGKPDSVARAAIEWLQSGFSTLKLKVGGGDDVAQISAVREAIGSEPRIRIDANGAWSVGDAVAILGELEPLDVELCEQPVADLEEMARVRAETGIRIAADESVTSTADASRARELGACDLITVKLAKVGGHAEGWGSGWGLPIYVSSALDGPVGIAAAGHFANQLRRQGSDAGIAHGLATQLLFSESIAAVGPEVREGLLYLPGGPGLGVELDEDALARHAI